jgi:hypothetical protein
MSACLRCRNDKRHTPKFRCDNGHNWCEKCGDGPRSDDCPVVGCGKDGRMEGRVS